MEKAYLIGIDIGTSSVKTVVTDYRGRRLAQHCHTYATSQPLPGYVEQDPLEIYASQSGVLAEVMAKGDLSPDAIAGISISNQRDTTILWH